MERSFGAETQQPAPASVRKALRLPRGGASALRYCCHAAERSLNSDAEFECRLGKRRSVGDSEKGGASALRCRAARLRAGQ